MVFLACGLNHKTAPVNVREKVAAGNDDKQHLLLKSLMVKPEVKEAAILSTCNRTEIYCEAASQDIIIPWLAENHALKTDFLSKHIYAHQADDAVKHAMRVASGLDSMILGETQILGQMKKTFNLAEAYGSIGPTLRPIFHHVFSACKRIRSNTAIGLSPVSVAYASVNLIKRIFKDLKTLNVLLIGSGETSQLLAKYLYKENVQQFYIASRTLENAKKLASTLDGHSLTIGDIPNYIAKADIVVSATACPLPFISKTLMGKALKQRRQAPIVRLDLSVPRDIEEEVHELANAYLYNIDDMQGLVNEGLSIRQDAANHAEQIIECELDDYIRWHRSLRAKETLCQYRDKMNLIGDDEVERVLTQVQAHKLNPEDALRELKRRLVNKLAHKPTVGLKRAASDNRQDILSIASYLFEE